MYVLRYGRTRKEVAAGAEEQDRGAAEGEGRRGGTPMCECTCSGQVATHRPNRLNSSSCVPAACTYLAECTKTCQNLHLL